MLDATGVLVADLNAGDGSSAPAGFTEFNEQLFFSAAGQDAAGESVGRELYRLDENGEASLVADINSGAGDSNPEGFTEFNGALYFTATGSAGRELYRLDAGGALTRIQVALPTVTGSNPSGLTVFDGNLYFAATGPQGRELYRLDAQQQVQQVQDIHPGSASSNPEGFTEFNGKLYFAATGAGGREAYVLNRGGQASQIRDINPGAASSNPAEFTVFADALYFSASGAFGRTLYRQNASGVNPVAFLNSRIVLNPTELTPLGDHLYFRATNQGSSSALFALNASERVSEIKSITGEPLTSPSGFAIYNDTLYFAATVNLAGPGTASTRTLYRLDLNGAKPAAVPIELPAGVMLDTDQPDEFLEFPQLEGHLYFAATGTSGRELYRVDRQDQVELVTDLYPGATGSNPMGFVTFGDNFYFTAEAPQVGRELFRLSVAPTTIAIVDGELRLIDATNDRDNRLVMSSDGVSLTIRDENGHAIFGSIPGMAGVGGSEVVIPLASLAGVHRLAVDLRGGDDSLTWDASRSSASLIGQFSSIRVAGGNHSSAGGDYLRVVGDGALTAVYLPDESGPFAGRVEITSDTQTTTIQFSDAEGVDVTGMERAGFVAPLSETGADEVLATAGKDAHDGASDALVVSGASSGVGFAPVHFFANQIVDLRTNENGDGGDAITLLNVGGLHGNDSLFVTTAAITGDASDTVHVAGALELAGALGVWSDRIELDGAIRTGGDVELSGQEAVEMFAGATLTVTGNATVFVQADADDAGGDSLAMGDGAAIVADFGAITLLAGGDLQLGDVRTSGSVTMVSLRGAIHDVADLGAIDITAATVDLQAALGIGTTVNPLETRLGRFTATSGGGLWVANAGDLAIGQVTAGGEIAVTVAGNATVAGEIEAGESGSLLLDVLGTLRVDAALRTSAGDLRLLAGQDLIVAPITLRSETGDLEFIADRDANGTGTLRIAAQIFAGTGDTIVSLAASDGQFSGALHGGGALVKQGAGTLELTAASRNTYSGGTELQAGTLIVNGVIGASGPSGPLRIAGGATLSGGGDVFAPVFATANDARIIPTGNLRLGDGSAQGMQFAGQLLIGDNQIVVLRDADFAEVGALTSLGRGATLIAAAGVQVPERGHLTGHGTIDGDLRVLLRGAVLPGDPIGALGARNLEFVAGAQFLVDVSGIVAGVSHDQFHAVGTVALQGAVLALSSLTFDAANGTVLVLISNDGFDPIVGRFIGADGAVLNEGAVLRVGQHNATLSYTGGVGGNDVTLTLGRQVFFALPGISIGTSGGGQSGRNTDLATAVFAYYAGQVLGAAGNTQVTNTPLTAIQEAQSGSKSDSTLVRGAGREESSTRVQQRFRLYFRVYYDALAREGDQEYDLAPRELHNLTAVFRRFRFPNGHFKVYIQEFGSKAERLILDVQVYDGRVVTEPLQEDENESQLQSQPPAPPVDVAPEAEQGGGLNDAPADDAPRGDDVDPPDASRQSAASPTALLLMSALRRRCRAEERDPAPVRRLNLSRFSHLRRRHNPR